MKKIPQNKARFYIIILIILVGVGLYLKYGKDNSPIAPENITDEKNTETEAVISITSKNIKEKNFTGKIAVVSGDSAVAKQAQAYIDEIVADFKEQADTDVPDMREKFGADNPTAQYELAIDAKYLKNGKSVSIIVLTYTYTGGAHGSSVYKVFTANISGEKILSLSEVVKENKQKAFTELVKKELLKWKPAGADASPVFKEDVQSLTFDSFTNWSLEDKNLIIYFSQYEIGPGVLGSVEFPLPISKIKDFLE